MTSPALSAPSVTDTQRRLGTAAICLATLAMPLDSSVNVAFPDIVNSFHLAVADIQWVVISYTLTYAALMLVAGRAGDLFGHRPIFLIGCAASAFAFLFCTIAPTYGWLLVARVLQGIAAALSLSCGPALITALYPDDQRTRVLGLYTLVFGVGGAWVRCSADHWSSRGDGRRSTHFAFRSRWLRWRWDWSCRPTRNDAAAAST